MPVCQLKSAAALVAVMALSACGSAAPVATTPVSNTGKKLNVVATFSIVGDFAANIGGEKIALTTLVGPDSDVHDFEAAPSDAASIADAQVIVQNGAALEGWLDGMVAASRSQALRVVLTESVTLRADDPHIWQNPRNAIIMVRTIANGFARADAANAAHYQANAARYIGTLEMLDAEIKTQIDALPPGARKIVTSHDALGYFGERYGVAIVGTVIDSVSTEAGDPSAQDIVKLADAIKAQQVRAIFLENMSNPKLVERVTQQAGVKVGGALYTDALGPPGSPGATYIDMMRANAKTLVAGLR